MGDWAVVIPVKRLAVAKSRLADFAGGHRPDLAFAFASDTVSAACACPEVLGVIVVTDDESVAALARSLSALAVPDEPGAGLNQALVHGAGMAQDRWPGSALAALSSDLPALRPVELGAALRAARDHRSAFVADSDGAGTTLLTSATVAGFTPRFGAGSAAAHRRAGVVELSALDVPSLRRDVDTSADLAVAVGLGVGTSTQEVLRILCAAT